MSVCAGQAQACLIRVAREDATGAPEAGAGNLYVTSGLVSMAWTPQVTTGSTLSLDNGCGERCVQYKAPDNLDYLNLVLTLCAPEPELLEMLAGGTVHALSDATTGYGVPATGVLGGAGDLSIELWENIIVDGSIFGQARYVFPRTRDWARQGSTHQNDPLDVVYNGIAVDAGAWGLGPGGDWDLLSDEDVTLYDWAIETQTLPTAMCGAQTLA